MQELESLKKEARRKARIHGHVLGRFNKGIVEPKSFAYAFCMNCSAQATIATGEGFPDKTNFHGKVFAINCAKADKGKIKKDP